MMRIHKPAAFALAFALAALSGTCLLAQTGKVDPAIPGDFVWL